MWQTRHRDEKAHKKAQRNAIRNARNRQSKDVDPEWTPFRISEKKYKAKFPPPDLSTVLDLALLDSGRMEEIHAGYWTGGVSAQEFEMIGLCRGRKAYCLPDVPGLVILPGYLSPEEQKELIRWSLCEHAKVPNETNLDTHYDIPPEGLWDLHRRCELAKVDPSAKMPNLILPRVVAENLRASLTNSPPGPRQLIANVAADTSNFADLAKEPKPPAAPAPSVAPASASELLPKLRWANVGWYYHWGTKQYDFNRPKAPIGSSVKLLCKDIVRSMPWTNVFQSHSIEPSETDGRPEWTSWEDTYEPDAGIVNFYQLKDTLMGHVDRSEVCATSPLVSISLGNAAIFLIGGLSREHTPIPVLLRSGDIVVMSGPRCRRAYHGIPRILDGTLPTHLRCFGQDEHSSLFGSYMDTTRININVRQVFPKEFDPWKRPTDGPTPNVNASSASDPDNVQRQRLNDSIAH